MKHDEQILLKGARLLIMAAAIVVAASAQEVSELATRVDEVAHTLTSSPTQFKLPAFYVYITTKPEMNAFAEASTHKIFLNAALVRVLYNDRGELAFVIAHEIGHLQDDGCKERTEKLGYRGVSMSRICESAADQIGMQYLLGAGYSPFDAAGVMGKLLMAYPAQNSVLAIIFGRMAADHPVDIDRIKHLTEYAQQACQQRPEICPK